MSVASKALMVPGVLVLALAAIVLLFTHFVVRYIAHDDVHILTIVYDPDGDDAYAKERTYEK